MDITGLQPVILVGRTESSTLLSLQINQRIAAQVLQVAGDQVLLALEGVPIVARLTSGDQATTLAEHRIAHFLVKENLGTSIRLQLLPLGEELPQEAAPKPIAGLAPNLLAMAGISTDEANTIIAEALLREGLPVIPKLVNELRTALSQVPGWGQEQAQQAAMLKAEGQPVTPETLSLALAQNNSPPLIDMVSELKAKLEQLVKLPLLPKEIEQLKKAITLLEQLQVNWDTPNVNLLENLHQALTALGKPIERELAIFIQADAPRLDIPEGQAGFERELTQFIQENVSLLDTPKGLVALQRDLVDFVLSKLQFPPNVSEKQAAFEADLVKFVKDNASLLNTPEGRVVFERELARFVLSRTNQLPQAAESDQEKWMTLARLPGTLAGKVPDSLAKDIEQLLDRVRWTQFRNVEPQTQPMRGNWLTLELPVIATAQGNLQSQPEIVQIRIAYQSEGGEKRKIDIDNTHLIMHFELDEVNSMDVDLAIVERKIGARVTVSNPELHPLAEDELPTLASGLEELGFILKTTYCETKLPVVQEPIRTAGDFIATRNRLDGTGGVDLEV